MSLFRALEESAFSSIITSLNNLFNQTSSFKDDAETAASNASTSATNASNSATSASTSASTASTAATNATNAATTATNAKDDAEDARDDAIDAADAAALSEQNAVTSETNAATSASQASTSATNASNSANAASTSETNAINSEEKAQKWAEEDEDEPVETSPDQFSAKHHAIKAEGYKDDAELAASNASTSETNASSSASSASSSASSASTSATNASNSASAALISEQNAATSETNAGTSATNAANSATQAEGFKDAAEDAAGLSIQGIKVISRLNEVGDLPNDPDAGDAYVIEVSESDRIYVYDGNDWTWFSVGSGTNWGQILGTLTDQTDLINVLNNKLESGDVADFETTTQLNTRDTANRNRTNHTGTQAISTISGLQTELDGKESTFSKNTAFNKNFGTASDTVTQGNDSRLSDSREWTADTVSQEEAEAGTATTRRAWTSERVKQAVIAHAGEGDIDSAYVYIAYADADDGTGFTLTFDSSKDYIAILSTDTEIASPAVGDFTGLWKKYKGEPGQDGIAIIGLSSAGVTATPVDVSDGMTDTWDLGEEYTGGILFVESAFIPPDEYTIDGTEITLDFETPDTSVVIFVPTVNTVLSTDPDDYTPEAEPEPEDEIVGFQKSTGTPILIPVSSIGGPAGGVDAFSLFSQWRIEDVLARSIYMATSQTNGLTQGLGGNQYDTFCWVNNNTGHAWRGYGNFWGGDGTQNQINYDREQILSMIIRIEHPRADITYRIKVGEPTIGPGVLTNKSYGMTIQGASGDVFLNSHNGTSLVSVDASSTIAHTNHRNVTLHHVPGDKVYMYINGVLVAETDHIPMGTVANGRLFAFEIEGTTDNLSVIRLFSCYHLMKRYD